jgi:hypothetical protein
LDSAFRAIDLDNEISDIDMKEKASLKFEISASTATIDAEET